MASVDIGNIVNKCAVASEEFDLTVDYKSLRNFTTCREHQEIINIYLSRGQFDWIFNRLESTALKAVAGNVVDSDVTQLRFGIQFLGNAIANYDENKQCVWPKLLPFLGLLLEGPDLASRKYALMVFYNCILDVPQHAQNILTENGLPLIAATLRLTFDENCEWGLFLLEHLLMYPDFLSLCCRDMIPQRLWSAMLQLTHSTIMQANTPKIHLSNLFFLEKRFIEETNLTFSSNAPNNNNSEKLREIVDILDVLCAASSADRYASHLKLTTFDRNSANLLCHAIAMLKAVHLVTPNQNIDATTVEELCNIPSFNFQKNLITLIANLCFRSVHLQNKLREVDGIPLLLDCCKLTARIPFITQWVVFAIRNACEDNRENQDLIAQMNKLGLTDIAV